MRDELFDDDFDDDAVEPYVVLPDDIEGMMTMRPYQVESVDAAYVAWREYDSVMIVMATGLGKTVVAADVINRWPVASGRVLFIAHIQELIWQARDSIAYHTGEMPAVEMGLQKEGTNGHGILDRPKVLVASIQTMSRRMQKFNPLDFGLIIIDECVVGDTLITLADGSQTPIQEIVESGQNVLIQTLNESTGLIQPRVVIGCKRSSATTICEVEIAGGVRLRCTTDHLVMTTIGYVHAGSLTPNHFVLNCRHNGTPKDAACLRKSSRRCGDASRREMYSSSPDDTSLRKANTARHGKVWNPSGVGWDGTEVVRQRRMGRVVDDVQHTQSPGVFRGLFNLLSRWRQAAINGLVESYRRARVGLVVHGRWFLREGRCSDFDRRLRQKQSRNYGRMVSPTVGHRGDDLQIEALASAPELQQTERAVTQRSDSTVRHSVDAVQVVPRRVGNVPELRGRVHSAQAKPCSVFRTRLPRNCGEDSVSQLVSEIEDEDSCENERGIGRQTETEDVSHLRRAVHDIQDEQSSLREDELQDCESQGAQCFEVSGEQGWNLEKSQVVSVTCETVTREVFDLWVEGNHNYFANSILVHNCHHSAAESYRRLVNYFREGNPNIKVLGITATPYRGDNISLGCIAETCCYEMGIREGIDEGYLVPIQQQYIVVDALDFSACRTTGGDLNEGDTEVVMMGGQVDDEMTPEQRADALEKQERMLHAIAIPTVKESKGRPTLVFCVTVEHAIRMAEVLRRYPGVTAAVVHGKTPIEERVGIVAKFKLGFIQILCGVGCFTEGFDAPNVAVVAMARPTKKQGLYVQMIGRGTRPLPNTIDAYDTAEDRKLAIGNSLKACVTVLDFVGNSGKHKLISTADVLAGDMPPDLVELAVAEMKETGQAEDIRDAVWRKQQERDEAEKRAEEERRLRHEAARRREEERRAKVRAEAEYRSRTVDPFGREAVPERAMSKFRGGSSDAQVEKLFKLGIEREVSMSWTVPQARVVIGQLVAKTGGDYIHPFTKSNYRGKSLKELPHSFLKWMGETFTQDNPTHQRFQRELRLYREQYRAKMKGGEQ